MKRQNPPRQGRRCGLTLMELVVVLLILAALAGILVPMLPNMLSCAHTATGATNTGELAKAVQLYQASYMKYPDNFDSLLNTSGTLLAYLPGGATGTPCGGDLGTFTLGPNTLAALNGAGITTVWNIDDTGTASDFSPTFNPYPATGGSTPLASGGTIAILSPTGALHLNLVRPDNTGNPPAASGMPVLAVFGVGRRCSMVGKTINDPPTHDTDDPTQTPNLVYARFGVVFQLTQSTNTDADALGSAQFVGTVSMHPNNVVSTDGHLQEYYNLVR